MAKCAEPTEPVSAPGPRSDGTNPILIVVGTLLAVVAVSFVTYKLGDHTVNDDGRTGAAALAGPAPLGACGEPTPADSSYSVDLAANPDPPRPEGTTFMLTLRHGGTAVTGAKVCVAADMPDMQHPGINYVAKESSGGRYEAKLQFGMGGSWRTSVIIAEPNKPVVSVPLSIQVADVNAS